MPYIAFTADDGTPDFRVTDEVSRRQCFTEGRCQLCGERLGKFFFFVGGPEAAKANAYFEPAAHLDCLIYAMQVCPFILGKMEHADIAKVQAAHEGTDVIIKADDTFSTVRNPRWVIVKATDYDLGKTPDGTTLILPRGIVARTTPLLAEKMTGEQWEQIADMLLNAK